MRTFNESQRMTFWAAWATAHHCGRFDRLCSYYPDLGEAFALARAGRKGPLDFLPEGTVEHLCLGAEDGFLDGLMEQMDRKGIDVCFREDGEYPPLLSHICAPPSMLYVKGRLAADPPLPIAVVGTRGPTEYGKQMAEVFGRAFAKSGCCVVSGMAAGVDAYAARGALSAGEAIFPTVAVLGCGVDVVYPATNRKLYEEIVARGAIVSEFPPGTKPAREHFPIRNRIISGMSRGVLVVEAAEKSGTSITAGYALEEGREVFAVPGRITDRMSEGTNRMIQRGEAKPVFCPGDVLAEFGLADSEAEGLPPPTAVPLGSLSPTEQAIWRVLKTGDKTVDELCETLALPVGQINSGLTAMLFSGIMKQLPGRVYSLDPAFSVAANDSVNGGTGKNV